MWCATVGEGGVGGWWCGKRQSEVRWGEMGLRLRDGAALLLVDFLLRTLTDPSLWSLGAPPIANSQAELRLLPSPSSTRLCLRK